MKRLLVVAYHFPPAGGRGAPGSLRAAKFVRHLRPSGWDSVVLSIREKEYPSNTALDRSLLRLVTPETDVVRTRIFHLLEPLLRLKNKVRRRVTREKKTSPAVGTNSKDANSNTPEPSTRYQRIKDGLTDLFKIPDEVVGWMLPACWTGRKLIRRHDIDAIFATGRPWTSLVIGASLKRITGRPFIADFRDPWVSNPFRQKPSRLKDWAERRLERWVITSADLIISNTESLQEEFLRRYPTEDPSRFTTILNGYDGEEFAALDRRQPARQSDGKINLLHSGVLYGKRDPKSLVDALRNLVEQGKVTPKNLQCELIGDIKLPYNLTAYIEGAGLSDIVKTRGEVSYGESIDAVSSCDYALLIQPGTTTQIPSKIFEYIGLGKPILAIAPPESAVSKLVDGFGLGSIASPEDVDSVAAMIEGCLAEHGNRNGIAKVDEKIRKRFDVRYGVHGLARVLDKIAEGRRIIASPNLN